MLRHHYHHQHHINVGTDIRPKLGKRKVFSIEKNDTIAGAHKL